jgi:2-dehydro-3-deoxy-D-arabinonate dehydratase
MHLFRTGKGPVVEKEGRYFAVARSWNDLVNDEALRDYLLSACETGADDETLADVVRQSLPPIVDQELWAAGVTYFRSRAARIEESQDAGGADFYDRVYAAERPELFLKATPHRVVGPGGTVRIRADSEWNVPEPELALVLDHSGRIVGHTIGNDMSSRSIEGDNPLYLPQAKVYRGCCALGPTIVLAEHPPRSDTVIEMTIRRGAVDVFDGRTTVAQMKRSFEELAEWLFRADDFPSGAFLLTGTGIVPPDDFTLAAGDEIAITISDVGTLRNRVDVA